MSERGDDWQPRAPRDVRHAPSDPLSTPAEGEDWKQRALEDFRRWLDDLAEDAPDTGDPDPPECDLHTLFAELAALRQEIRLQNREQSRAGRELAKAVTLYETAGHLMQRREEDPAAFETRVARAAESRCLCSVLEVRDALVRGREAAVRLRDRPRWFRRPSRGVAGVVEGYELALRRFDRMLSRFGVQRLPAVGHPFDSRTMHAMETRRVGALEDGVVVEEFRSGFVRDGEALRLADVAVNRLERLDNRE